MRTLELLAGIVKLLGTAPGEEITAGAIQTLSAASTGRVDLWRRGGVLEWLQSWFERLRMLWRRGGEMGIRPCRIDLARKPATFWTITGQF